MPVLIPAPTTLGLFSPAIGPWFDVNTVNLGVPAADLSVALPNLTAVALPPAAGTLALYIATNTRPPALAGLRKADGTPAFTTGNMVALFRLLPEVESRLHALTANIPGPSGSPAGAVPTRPRVRHFAYEFPAPANLAALVAMMHTGFAFPSGVTLPVDQAQHLGLTFNANVWGNDVTPMNDLFRPGKLGGAFAELLRFTNQNLTLWSFDSRGRPLDPGAVADWWNFLTAAAPGFAATNLWEPSLQPADLRTAPVAGQQTLHLVNAHEGPLDATTRARVNPQNLTAVAPSDHLFVAAAPPTIGFTAAPGAPAPDDLPSPLAAVLPDGSYAATAAPWAGGAVPGLTRDFCRVAVVSVEHQLVGQVRHDGSPRANRQQDPATRVSPGQVTAPVLLDTHEQVLAAMPGIFAAGPAPRQLVTGQLDRGLGPLPALPAGPAPLVPPLPQVPLPPVAGLPNLALPTAAPALVATSLVATVNATTVTGQKALLTFSFPPALAGAWVRAWTQGFDPAKGERYHLDGGAGLVLADGSVSLVADLQDGEQSPAAQMGVDIIVVTAQGSRLFADLRFPRPAASTSAPVNFNTLTGGDVLLVCETGPTTLAGPVASGCNLVVLTNPAAPRLVDPTTIPAAVQSPTAVINQLANTDRIELTDNAFRRTPTGDADAVFTAVIGVGAAPPQRGNLHRQARALIPNGWQPGFPAHGMERHETVLGNPGAGQALVAGAPGLARWHERLHHRQGHPLCPATTDLHATGARLVGPGALAALEFTRDRTAGTTPELAVAAFTPLPVPAAPAAPAAWAVGLRTIGAGVEAELGLAALLDLISTNHSFTADWNAAVAWWNGLVPAALQLTGNEAGDAPRALDRRILAARGLREGATSLLAAINRAEDFIYIETPALDDLSLGDTGDTLQLWQALIARMTARPALRVILCVPVFLAAGAPKALQRVRDNLLLTACDTLTSAPDRAARFARFSPAAGPGRSLRLTSTTVVVDDAYALTGTTHLWRRGLSFDSSFAAAVFDEALTLGRPADLVGFRRRLLAGRLGIHLADLPDDPAELVLAIQLLQQRGGFGSLAVAIIPRPDPTANANQNPIVTDEDAWNPDGSLRPGFNPATLLAAMMANDITDEFNDPTP